MNNKYIEIDSITELNKLLENNKKRFFLDMETEQYVEDKGIEITLGLTYYKLNPDYREFKKGVMYMMSDWGKVHCITQYSYTNRQGMFVDRLERSFNHCRRLTLDEAQKALDYFNISEPKNEIYSDDL